jgi:hypothetical protein
MQWVSPDGLAIPENDMDGRCIGAEDVGDRRRARKRQPKAEQLSGRRSNEKRIGYGRHLLRAGKDTGRRGDEQQAR